MSNIRSAYEVAKGELAQQFGSHTGRDIWMKLGPADFEWLERLITAERERVREAARAVAQRQIDAAERNKFTVSWLSCAETIDAELRAMPLEPT